MNTLQFDEIHIYIDFKIPIESIYKNIYKNVSRILSNIKYTKHWVKLLIVCLEIAICSGVNKNCQWCVSCKPTPAHWSTLIKIKPFN